jgi:hypothetical protein
VGAEQNSRAPLEQVLDGGQRSPNASVFLDYAALDGNVEIHAD